MSISASVHNFEPMKTKTFFIGRRVLAGAMIFAFTFRALANPTGLTVVSGTATAQASGSQLNITAGNNAFLNWQSFNIGAGESTIFNQPNAGSIVWNRINNQNPSQIYGNLQANGVVVLLNSSGFYFGPNSFVSAAGLVVSTANCMPPQNAGGVWEFNGPPPLASIVNYGSIKVGNGGSAYLIADQVENHGTIEAPGGSIGLAAGQTVTLSERPDGRGMSMNVVLPQGSVNNYGNLVADGGVIALNAKVVNQNGLVQANSVRNVGGVVELIAADSINLGASSQISAQGDDSLAGSAGGQVTIKAGNTFDDVSGSILSVAGGVNGGNGGQIEISAPTIGAIHSRMNGSARSGSTGGSLLLDPDYIILDSSGGDVAGSGTVAVGDNAGSTLDLNVFSAFYGFSTIALQAKYDITVGGDAYWSLFDTTGNSSGQLKLEAGNNIILQDGAAILGSYDNVGSPTTWSVWLRAGVDFNTGLIKSGTGSILLNGSAQIQTFGGDITLEAGQDITVGLGSITTFGGGSIMATAKAGSINTGTSPNGYDFNYPFTRSDVLYAPSYSLGGISTAAGGNVILNAGLDVISFLPVNGNLGGDAGSGAFGVNVDPTIKDTVSITAGRNVTGHFVVANGTGIIQAGNNAGTAIAPLALSLIAGSWAVNANQDIILQEVRNPNGIFNSQFNSRISAYGFHQFDYAADASVSLTAGNSVQLLGNNLPRNSGSFEQAIPEIFAPTLDITAGLGGVILGQNIILFPSATGVGELNIQTTGPLESLAVQQYLALPTSLQAVTPYPSATASIIMSDSASSQYRAAGAFGLLDHATQPLYLGHETTANVSVGGDMNNILLSFPEAAQVTVGGNMNRSTVIAQNLKSTDVTQINVSGSILNREEFTTIPLATAPDLALLLQAYGDETALFSRLHYDSVNHTLTVQGRLSSQDAAVLAHLPIQLLDQYGVPQFDTLGNPILYYKSVLDSTTLGQLVAASADVPGSLDPLSGFIIGGGGTFNLTAQSLNLGTTAGIRSVGPDYNSFLASAAHLTRGADINVTLTGNLNMFSTAIASFNGGDINIKVGFDAAGNLVNPNATVNVGSSTFTGSSDVARGIFTSAKSDVTVIAGGSIDVNGSRIAAYDGGNVTVESLTGNVNAGSGGSGSVAVEEIYVDPITYQIYKYSPTIPGSGILATTFPTRGTLNLPAPTWGVGNILVEAPNGNINASAGGVVQLPLNGNNYPDALVDIFAGYEIRDSGGQAVTAANLSSGTPVEVSPGCNIDASGSGVIGSTIKLEATGNIIGLVFARNNIDLNAQQNVSVTALAQGSVNVNSGGTISGTIIGVGGVSASGSSIDASLLSQNVSASGDTSGAKEGFAQGGAANATANAASASDDATKFAKKSDDTGEDDSAKKKKGIGLVQKVSRVTVILPPKKLSEKTTANNPL